MVTALLFLASPGAFAFEELQTYGVGNFDGTGECSAGSDLSFTVTQADAFRDIVAAWGTWDGTTSQVGNLSVDGHDFADASLDSPAWGEDSVTDEGIDDADVAYLSSHGTFDCSGGAGESFSVMVMGDGNDNSGEECWLETDSDPSASQTQDILVGNTDTEIIYFDTCSSAQKCVFDNDGYDPVNGAELIMWAGYHGVSFDSSAQVTALENYVSNSRVSGVGDNWLDYRWVNSIFADSDQCPTVIIWGSSSTNRDDMYNNGGVEDWIDTGAHTGMGFYFITNCDPADGNQL
jgi:hypothetical protein